MIKTGETKVSFMKHMDPKFTEAVINNLLQVACKIESPRGNLSAMFIIY